MLNIFKIFLLTFFCISADTEIITAFGKMNIDNEFEKIYKLPKMQRLGKLKCLGSANYWMHLPKFSFLEISGDILFLLNRFGANTKEKIAGFISNMPQPVFQEVSDVVFGKKNYVQSILENYLAESGVNLYIKKYDWEEKDIIPNNPSFKMLNQPYPNLCASNIAFYIRAGLTFKLIKPKDVKKILSDLRYNEKEGFWFFTKKKSALKFANICLVFFENVLCSANNQVLRYITGLILKRGLELKRITKDDLSFLTDDDILKKLYECDDLKLKKLIAKAKNVKNAYRILENDEFSPDFLPKETFKCVDPLFYNKHSKKYKKLSEIDKKFAGEFKRIENLAKKGKRIQTLGLN